MVVSPKDTPKLNGLRKLTGPSQGPPTMSHTVACPRPASVSVTPTTHAMRHGRSARRHAAIGFCEQRV
jgi:hypothetical protein